MDTDSHLLQITTLSSTLPPTSWAIRLILDDSVLHPELHFRLPIGVQEEAEVFWYLEKYTKSPFDVDRADKAVCLIRKYTASLFEQLYLADVVSKLKLKDSNESRITLMVDVVEMPEGSKEAPSPPSIQRVLWELLEQPALWAGTLDKVVVRRRPSFADTSCSTPTSTHTGHLQLWKPRDSSNYYLNVLLVVARDLDPNKPEVDPTIGLKPLITLQDELSREAVGGKATLSLEIVRPGTYSALRKHLQIATMKHGKGYYHLVHFDMHGVLRARSTDKIQSSATHQPRACLSFAPKTHSCSMDFIPARKVAVLLRDHGVRLVVSNACQSANARTSGTDANLARVFIEEGISNVAAMQVDVMSGSATAFSARFYRAFLQGGLSFSEAVHDAREELRRDEIRSARFGLEVRLEDWVVPVAYLCDVDTRVVPPDSIPTGDLKTSEVPAWRLQSFVSAIGTDLVGRGRDVLSIEKDLIESKILIITGQAGVGKTALLRYLAGVWRATKFVEQVIYVDCAQSPFPAVGDSVGVWQTQDKTGAAEKVAQFVEDCHKHSSVLIFDSIDLRLSGIPQSNHQRVEFSALVDRLVNSTLKYGQKKPMVILVGRGGDQYWSSRFETISGRIYKLAPLDLPFAVSLGSRILQQEGMKTSTWNVKETDVLYRLVNLLSRNPLALELVLPHAAKEKSLAGFYETIHFHLIPSMDLFKFRPSTPGADHILHDIDSLFVRSSYRMRNVLRSLSLFWLEGPALAACLTVLTKVFAPLAGKDKFGVVLRCQLLLCIGLGAWNLDPTTKRIVEIHPLFSIYLRSQPFDEPPFGAKLEFPTLTAIFRSMLIRSHQLPSFQHVRGAVDFMFWCNIHKPSLFNVVTCLKYCLANRTSDEWPKQIVSAFIDSNEFVWRGSVPDHCFFLDHLEPALKYYVQEFGGPLKCLTPEGLPFALKMSNHLTTAYLFDVDFVLDRAAQQAQYSLELIRASEWKYPPLSISNDMFGKHMAFRLKATISLSQRNFAEAEKYWNVQSELEQIILDPNGYSFAAGEEVATIRKFLPALAELSQRTWTEIMKSMKSAGSDENLRHSIRPYFQQFSDIISGMTGGIVSRVVEEAGYGVGYFQEDYVSQGWQSDLEQALDQGDSARMLRIQHKLLVEDWNSGDFSSASIRVGMLQQHLEAVPNPPECLVSWIWLAKTVLECVKGLNDDQRSKVADVMRILLDENIPNILMNIAGNMDSSLFDDIAKYMEGLS